MIIKLIPFVLTYLFCFSSQALELEVTVYDHLQSPIKNIVVYIESTDGIELVSTQKTIEVSQLDKSFTPYISVIQTGNQVRFNNQDDITHHIYSPIGKNKFEFKIFSGQQKTLDSFADTGEIAMGCNIHDWMSGYILVLDTPYFDKTNKQGIALFSIKDKGNYRLTLWHPQINELDQRLIQDMKLNENSKIEITLSKPMAPLPEQKNEDDFDFLSDY